MVAKGNCRSASSADVVIMSRAPIATPTPTSRQVSATLAIVGWYVKTHHGKSDVPGTAQMFCDPAQVGLFAADPAAISAGDGAALFRMLVATSMFQRRQDQQILRILRRMPTAVVKEVSDQERLLALARKSACPHLKTNAALLGCCDLGKDPRTGRGRCAERPHYACHLKEHTVALKRYGHFGKVPTSIALTIAETGARDMSELCARTIAAHRSRLARAVALETALCGAWRVSQKIASMFLSAVTNPDLSDGLRVPWAERVDWTYFVVVDSNVDLFLASIGYRGASSYDARRAFVRGLARCIDLRRLRRGVRAFNPRLVQQALYLFMSATNRRALADDCSHLGPATCARCPEGLRARCPVRHRATV